MEHGAGVAGMRYASTRLMARASMIGMATGIQKKNLRLVEFFFFLVELSVVAEKSDIGKGKPRLEVGHGMGKGTLHPFA